MIGLDIGGSKIEGAVIDKKGRIKHRLRIPTNANKDKKTILKNIAMVVEELQRLYPKEKGVIGIGIPGFIHNKKLLNCPNIKALENTNIEEELKRILKQKVHIENDANCFALAETKYGAAKGKKNVIGLIIGTGIGAGIIINGKIYKGANGGAGEIGHTWLGKKRFEALASGRAANKKKDYLKSKAFDYLAKGIANIIMTFNPETIVLGGGLSNTKFYKELNSKVKEYVMPSFVNKTKVVKNKLGDSAGVIGATIFSERFI